MSLAKGRPKSEEHKEKIRQALLGHEVSKETRRKMSLSNKASRAKKYLASLGYVPLA